MWVSTAILQISSFCFLANIATLRIEDKSKNENLIRPCPNLVVEKIIKHYQKSCIPTLHRHKMAEKIVELYSEYNNLYKIKPEKRKEHIKIKQFRGKLDTTMPFYSRKFEKRMEDSKKGKTQMEKEAIQEDMLFLKSMKTDRIAQYASKDKQTAKLQEARRVRKQNAENASKKAKTHCLERRHPNAHTSE